VSRSTSTPRVAVVGTGANGGAVAAALTRAGWDTTLIEQWPEHVRAIRADGLSVRLPDGSIQVTSLEPLDLCEVAVLRRPFDLVIIAMKAYDTRWSCELMRPLSHSSTVFVGIQNGMTTDDMLDIAGPARTIGAVIEVAAYMDEPGRIVQEAPMWFAVGAPDQLAAEHVGIVAAALGACGTVEIVEDIVSAKWMKLVANASELVPSAILGLPLAEAIRVPGMYEFMAETGKEAARTAVDLGHHLVPIFGTPPSADPAEYAVSLLDQVLAAYALPTTRTTVLQDWMKGRRAEIEEINGRVVRERLALGDDAPRNQRVLDLARRIEAGELRAVPENAELLLSR